MEGENVPMEKLMRWGILVSCAIAAVPNVLYLCGLCPQQVTSYGFLLLIICWAANLILRRKAAAEPAAQDTPIERIRGMATLIFAALWLVTTGLSLFW